MLEVVVFRVGSERYAIDAVEAAEAIEIDAVTMLPGLPPFYRGLIIHQGIVYPLVDIRPLAGAPFDIDFVPAHAILFASNDRTIAVAAASVESFVRVDRASIAMSTSREGRATPAIRGVTNDGIVLIDIHLLLSDARLVVDNRSTVSEPQAADG
jgi:chemotaxis signal transduction protein